MEWGDARGLVRAMRARSPRARQAILEEWMVRGYFVPREAPGDARAAVEVLCREMRRRFARRQ